MNTALLLLLLTVAQGPLFINAAVTDVFRSACATYSDPPPGGWKRWSSASTWSGGIIPGSRGNFKSVTIPCNTGIILDMSITVDQLVIQGSLKVQDRGPFQVNANFIIVQGRMNIGSPSSPYTGKITFNLTNGGYSYNYQGITVGIKAFAVIGGLVEFNGMYGNQAAWTTLTKTAGKGATSLTVSGDVSAWPVGGTVAIASTDYEYTQAESRVITSVRRGSGVTTLGLNKPLTYMHWGDPIYTGVNGVYMSESAEVALLDRTITIQGSPEKDPLMGGHFIVFQTTLPQHIIGLELTNMGQQGLLGRYPMHFHLCQDVSGAYVKKLSIHHSLQRCVVVHGTWNHLIDGNAAYRTKGHCYFLEDGIEYGNTFSNNLGFYTESPSRGITSGSSAIQSDGSPSTFWISNPNNSWINNVAGGSSDSGFWFELSAQVLGPSATHPLAKGVYPHFVPLRNFVGNVAHSNMRAGLRSYSDGYRPRQSGGRFGVGGPINAPNSIVVIKDFRAYKNAMIGMFIHETDSLIIDGGYFADNRVVALELHQVEKVTVQNAVILGETNNVGNPTECDKAGNEYAKCQPLSGCSLPVDPSRGRTSGAGQTMLTMPMFGILIDQSEYPSHGLTVLGNSYGAPFPQHVYNVTFGLFNNKCRVAAAITANGHTPNAIFLASHSSKQLKFVDNSPRFYMAPRALGILGFETPSDAGPTSASYVFRDEDGTLVGGPGGYVVTDNPAALPAGNPCKALGGGYGWSCPYSCYRTVAFALAGTSGSPTFTITNIVTKKTVSIQGYPTSFINLASGTTYEISISPMPTSAQIWYADPEGCKGTTVFQLAAPAGFKWDATGASWLSCTGSVIDPATSFQIASGCFNGPRSSVQIILGGKTNATLLLTLSSGTRACNDLQCGMIAAGSKWTYNDKGDRLPSPAWATPSASTSGWKSNVAVFGYGGGEVTPIQTTSQMGGVTYYFRQKFSFQWSSCLSKLLLGIVVNDGVLVFLNGKEIYRNNLPSGAISASTTALKTLGDWRVPAFTTASIDIRSAGLIAGENLIAVEVHASSPYSWNARFDMYLSATGVACSAAKKVFSTNGLPSNIFG